MGERYQLIAAFLKGRSVRAQVRLPRLSSSISLPVDTISSLTGGTPATFTLSSTSAGTAVTLEEEEIAEVRSTADNRGLLVRMDDGTEFVLS